MARKREDKRPSGVPRDGAPSINKKGRKTFSRTFELAVVRKEELLQLAETLQLRRDCSCVCCCLVMFGLDLRATMKNAPSTASNATLLSLFLIGAVKFGVLSSKPMLVMASGGSSHFFCSNEQQPEAKRRVKCFHRPPHRRACCCRESAS